MTGVFRTFARWPHRETAVRKWRPFQSTYQQTLDLLDAELKHLEADVVVIQLNLKPDEIRLDGLPRRDAQPAHPGVIISFDSKHGALQYACDDCQKWTDNIRAIALTLERLRLAERYGVAKRGEQYKGWTALPAPIGDGFKTKRDAAFWICDRAGAPSSAASLDPATGNIRRDVLNAAIVACHPDKNGGSDELFLKLTKAREMLGL